MVSGVSVFKSTGWKLYVAELTKKYGEPGRFYHGLLHIEDCLEQLKNVPDLFCEDGESVELALWFHDVIYDPKRGDNESASAYLAAEWLAEINVAPSKIERVKQLIQITGHRGEPKNPGEELIADIDLSILGINTDYYERYAAAIRQEYAHVPDAEYRDGRASILRGFLDREWIFRTEFFRVKYEAAARKNIESEIRSLV